ncbi:MAG: hypothetical protein LUD73_04465 [Lachnospiraceae bacterium]|nr:hypothetical protein [Lachnospiraceae bacterium]
MRRKILLLLLVLSLNLSVIFAGHICGQGNMETGEGKAMAWWTLLYERPNPERLPGKVKFWRASK